MALSAIWLILLTCCLQYQCDALTATHHHSFDRLSLSDNHFHVSVLDRSLLNETISTPRQSSIEKHSLQSEGDSHISHFPEQKQVQALQPLTKGRFVLIAMLLVCPPMVMASKFQAMSGVWNLSRAFNWFCLASCIGAFGGLLSFLYMKVIQVGLSLVWTHLAKALHENVFSSHPEHCLYIITAIGGLLWGLLALVICPKMPVVNMNNWIEAIHSTGSLEPRKFFLPVLVLSALNIIVGSSIGPEAPLVLAGGALGTWIARLAGQDEVGTRCCSMCGGACMLAVFFGFPFVPAIFVLELPHRNGLQYTELLMPMIWASIVAALVSRFCEGPEIQCDPDKMGFTCFSYTVPKKMYESDVLMAIVYGTVAAAIAILQIGLIKHVKQGVEWFVARSSTPVPVLTALGGLVVGVVGIYFPHTLFWGEFQMQALTDANPGAYPVPWLYKPMLSHSITDTLLQPEALYLCIAMSKAFSVAICISIGYCGGVVFPVMLVGLGFSWALFPADSVAAMCIMFSLLASVCRVPVAAILLGAFSMRPKVDFHEEGAIGGLGVMLASLSISVIIATVLTSWYPLFETSDRKDFLSPFTMTEKLSTEKSAAENAACLQSDKVEHENGFVKNPADFGVHSTPRREKDAGVVTAESTEGAVPAAAAHALLGKASSAREADEEAPEADSSVVAKLGREDTLYTIVNKLLRQLVSFPEDGPIPFEAMIVLAMRGVMLICSIVLCMLFVGRAMGQSFCWVPLMTFLGCLLSTSGVPVAGGTLYFPIMTMTGMDADRVVFFIVATQIVSCGVLTPMAWVGKDTRVFIKPAFLYGFPPGLLGVLLGTFAIPLHGEAIKLFFSIAMLFLLFYTVHGLFHSLAEQDEPFDVQRHAIKLQVAAAGLVGGVLVAYIGIGIEKVMFFLLTWHGVNAVKSCITGISMCGFLCLVTTLGKCAHAEFPLELWLLGIPGLIIGSVVGPCLNSAMGSKRVLAVFVCLLAFDVIKTLIGFGLHHE